MTRRALLAVVPNTRGTSPGQRTSIEAWEPVLRDAGWDVDYAVFADAELEHLLRQPRQVPSKAAALLGAYARQATRVLRHAADYDAVYIYREAALLGPAVLERYVARRGVPLVYELDDPLHIPYESPVNGAFARLKFFGKVPALCRMADAVVVNSRPLEAYAARHNARVWLIPSLIDESRYVRHDQPRDGAPVCIGWTGSHTTVSNLAEVAPVLRRLQEELAVEVRIIGSRDPGLEGVETVATDWSEATEVDDLRGFDIGVAPIPDVAWNQWKFFVKVAQYMALGIPTVASSIGAVGDQIEHGVTGYLATDAGSWYEHLHRLATDPQMRHRMGDAAFAVAMSTYTVAANAEKIVAVFDRLPLRQSIAR